ncbi:uncharacterized protein [Hoplias malabaricus]|uniref:uncharacterized protein n=1 Tax=Hoplias malabaricus TaxID=27720 RepID=UPI0034619177
MFSSVTLLILSGFIKTLSVAESLKVVVSEDTVVAHVDEDVVLPCSLQNTTSAEDMEVSWLKKEMTVHLYEHRADRKDKQAECYRGRTALFKEELKNGNVSLKLSAAQFFDEGFYTCLVVSSSGPQSATLYLKVIYVFAAWKIALICTPLCAGLIVFVAYVNRKKIREMFTGVQYSAVAKSLINSDEKDELDLREYSKTEEGYMDIIPAIPYFTKARFYDCNLTDQLLKTLKKALMSKNSSLKELEISDDDLRGSRLCILSSGLKRLEALIIRHCKLNKESCATVRSVLQSENCLKILDLSNNILEDSGVEKLCEGLKSKHCKLERLGLVRCKLGPCTILASVLQLEHNSLKLLYLSNNELKDSGVEKLCEGLQSSHCKLEKLRLSRCKLSGDSCVSLASVLKSDTNSLKELDLSSNDLEDSGVEKLCDGLKSEHCKLETLGLTGCKLTGKSCVNLASVLNSNQNLLKELDLSYNDLPDSEVKELHRALNSSSGNWKEFSCRLYKLEVEEERCERVQMQSEKEERKDPAHMTRDELKPYACKLTLDPNTVNTLLSLSEGNRKVKCVKEKRSYPDHPERFSDEKQVLCRESLTGCCYWETEWIGRGVVDISVAYKSIGRKGDSDECEFGANKKSWSLICFNNSYSVCHNKKLTTLPSPSSSSNRVGVYVDCPAGILSFYSVSTDTHTLTHLHTFTTTFTEPLCAGFALCSPDSSVRLCQIE